MASFNDDDVKSHDEDHIYESLSLNHALRNLRKDRYMICDRHGNPIRTIEGQKRDARRYAAREGIDNPIIVKVKRKRQ